MKHILGLFFFTLFAVVGRTESVPALINYQGRLANPDGSPLPTGDYELRFGLYDAATNGALIWGPQVFDGGMGAGRGPKIPVVQGYFNVMLGPVDTNGASLAGAFNASNRFVEVTVSNRPPILPRQQILSAPFALMAASVANGSVTLDKLASRPVGTNVPVGGIAVSETIISLTITNASNFVAIPTLTITLATTGRPVFVGLTCGTNTNEFGVKGSHIEISDPSTGVCCIQAEILFTRNGQRIGGQVFRSDTTAPPANRNRIIPSSSVSHLDLTAPAGSNTYSVGVILNPAGARFWLVNARLVAFEL
jgi:hypothetical protein